MNLQYRYFTVKRKDGSETRLTIVTELDGDTYRIGWAACNAADTFKKSMGREIADGRLRVNPIIMRRPADGMYLPMVFLHGVLNPDSPDSHIEHIDAKYQRKLAHIAADVLDSNVSDFVVALTRK